MRFVALVFLAVTIAINVAFVFLLADEIQFFRYGIPFPTKVFHFFTCYLAMLITLASNCACAFILRRG